MEVAPVPVLRPSYLMDQEEFQGDLVEAPANIFYQKVNASRATAQRIQFQWRSPSDNLLASPVMFLRLVLKITCPQVWTQVQAYINTHGVLAFEPQGNVDLTELNGGAAGADMIPGGHQGTRPQLPLRMRMVYRERAPASTSSSMEPVSDLTAPTGGSAISQSA